MLEYNRVQVCINNLNIMFVFKQTGTFSDIMEELLYCSQGSCSP